MRESRVIERERLIEIEKNTEADQITFRRI